MVTFILTFTLLCWILYYIVMGLKRRRDYLIARWYLRYPVTLFIYFGVLVDVVYNLTVGSIIFAQWPKELLFTSRLERNKGSQGWRSKLANSLCNLLDKADPSGDHCKRK